jgi:hypothetical protein
VIRVMKYFTFNVLLQWPVWDISFRPVRRLN